VHRPAPPPDDDAPKAKLSKDEVRALLDVAGASTPPRRPLWRRILLLPGAGFIWMGRGLVPTVALYVLCGLWVVALVFEIRNFIASGRRW
jgi:hypothetical protein